MSVSITHIPVTVTIVIKHMIDENERFAAFVAESVRRHINHDWGDTYDEDKALNDAEPEYAMSTYKFDENFKI